jgi:hypothetical protein
MNRVRPSSLFVDRQIQGSLLVRVAFYWLFCLTTVALLLIAWKAFNGPPRRFIDLARELYVDYAPALLASLILLPIALLDILRVSGRFLEPFVRVRTALKELAEGRPAQPLNFRDNPIGRELATYFNRAAARIASGGADRGTPTEEMSEPVGLSN